MIFLVVVHFQVSLSRLTRLKIGAMCNVQVRLESLAYDPVFKCFSNQSRLVCMILRIMRGSVGPCG